MTPTLRLAAAAAGVAVLALVVQPVFVAIAACVLAAVAIVDAMSARRSPEVRRSLPNVLSRAVPAPIELHCDVAARVRQPAPPDVRIENDQADAPLVSSIVAMRRGRHVLPAPAARVTGPLRLGAWTHPRCGEDAEVLVYPDLPAAHAIARAVRQRRFHEPGHAPRGPLGLGTEFESIRDWLPDDDIRQLNVRATARLGKPMSNRYRVEQDRDVMCVVDIGRLMAAPLGDRTRLDAALDAATAVALVADEVGDRVGVLAFDDHVRRHLRPRRSGGNDVVRAIFDLEPTSADADYELAFRTIGGGKRSLVLVFTDLLEEGAARPLVEAIPVLAKRHAVAVASATDTDLDEIVRTPPRAAHDVFAQVVAVDVLTARSRVVARLRAAGADVVEAPPGRLAAACVGAYLRAKSRARL